MGVLACARNGCNNIMCDRYSSTYGYICNECFEELVLCGLGTDIESFMDSDKQCRNDTHGSARDIFGMIFELNPDW